MFQAVRVKRELKVRVWKETINCREKIMLFERKCGKKCGSHIFVWHGSPQKWVEPAMACRASGAMLLTNPIWDQLCTAGEGLFGVAHRLLRGQLPLRALVLVGARVLLLRCVLSRAEQVFLPPPRCWCPR